MRRKRVFTVVGLALAAFLLATNPVVADAAGQITGKSIKNSSVTGKDIKDQSLLAADFQAGELPAGGVPGPAGTAGPKGEPGPRGAAGPQGPAGSLLTTPVNVSYTGTSASAHDVTAVGGILLSLECGTGRIGPEKADFVQHADQLHGVSTRTDYNGSAVVSSTTYSVYAPTGTSDLDGANVSGATTHSTENYHGVAVNDGLVYTVDMFITRDERQSRPVCEFIGSVTQQGAVTVSPS